MQTLTRPQSSNPHMQDGESLLVRRKRRFSPFMLSGTILTLLLVISAGAFIALQQKGDTHAADDAVNCTLIVPAHPLSAQGLATPYQLTATDDDNKCNEANKLQTAFVEGAVFDPVTSQISIYDPLVTDKGKKPAIAPVVPKLPNGAVVALWFGFNGTTLTLKSNDNSLQDGNCVGGIKKSPFGQFAYCNAPAFFTAANKAIQAGKLVPPPLGKGQDGLICPTVRDFGIVDQDQSDNVTTAYLADHKGRTAQMNAANIAQLAQSGEKTLVNGSDNRLLSVAVDGALGCKSWEAPDLVNPGHTATALPLNELQAAAYQGKPVALVPGGDPMVKVDDDQNLRKLNLYRVGVDQSSVDDLDNASTKTYCKNVLAIGAERILLDAKFTRNQPSPDAAAANNLFTFLAQRFNTTFGADGGINCQELLDAKSPIKVKNNGDDVAVSATIYGLSSIDTSNCVANGVLVQDCQGKTQVDDQTCSFKLNVGDSQADLNCPNDHHGHNSDSDNNNKHDNGSRHHNKLNMDQMDQNENNASQKESGEHRNGPDL